jgi:hypothetical protein
MEMSVHMNRRMDVYTLAFTVCKNMAVCTHHGPNIYKDTKSLMSSLLVFNRVYRLEIKSVMLVFSTPLTFSLVYPPPSPSFLYEQCVTAGGGGVIRGRRKINTSPQIPLLVNFLIKTKI